MLLKGSGGIDVFRFVSIRRNVSAGDCSPRDARVPSQKPRWRKSRIIPTAPTLSSRRARRAKSHFPFIYGVTDAGFWEVEVAEWTEDKINKAISAARAPNPGTECWANIRHCGLAGLETDSCAEVRDYLIQNGAAAAADDAIHVQELEPREMFMFWVVFVFFFIGKTCY